jgi:hypothetical protein
VTLRGESVGPWAVLDQLDEVWAYGRVEGNRIMVSLDQLTPGQILKLRDKVANHESLMVTGVQVEADWRHDLA